MDELTLWRNAVDEVTTLLQEYPERVENSWLRNFPHGSCSIASYAIGRLLLERHGEQWLIESRSGYGSASHTWLVRDTAEGPAAEIDATVHQFPQIATEPFVGWGVSPAREHFPALGTSPIYVGLIDDWWHHGQTEEVYQWLFPQLGLRPFDRHSSMRDLMPERITNPPEAQLADRMIDAQETSSTDSRYALFVSWKTSRTLLRNSDAAMKRGNQEHGEYRNHYVIKREEMDDDFICLFADPKTAPADASAYVGVISSGRYQAMPWAEVSTFDASTLGMTQT